MITNARARQGVLVWLRSWGVAPCIFAAVGAIGLGIAAAGFSTLGIWCVAIALIGMFVSLSGIAGTRYQREVRTALRPIRRSNVRRAERVDGRWSDLEHVEHMQVPPELSALRVDVMDAMRGQLVQRRQHTLEEAMQEVPARIARRKTLTRVGSMVDESITALACWAKLKQVVLHFLAEEDDRVRRHQERASNAVDALSQIVPPEHKAAVHQVLFNAINAIDDLTHRRRVQYQAGDETGLIETTHELVEQEKRMRAAIKTIRGWL
jgi:hypothetical protein